MTKAIAWMVRAVVLAGLLVPLGSLLRSNEAAATEFLPCNASPGSYCCICGPLSSQCTTHSGPGYMECTTHLCETGSPCAWNY